VPRSYDIPFNRPFIVGKELEYIADAVRQGHLSGNGPFARKCQDWIQQNCGVRKALLTHSGTGALEMAALLADIGPGDEVILPSFTFVSTATAFTLRGANLHFVDIRPDTLNIDETLITECINDRTKVIVPVHYAGVGCDMDAIGALARAHDLLVIEDAAMAFTATYKGHPLGGIGQFGVFSFHETKNCIAGEGGALAVNDERFCERAEIIHEKGTDRAKFFRGQVDKYTWVDIGSSFQPSELTAAFLFAQLEHAGEITAKRRELYDRYRDGLQLLSESGGLRLPAAPPEAQHNSHIFHVILDSETTRDALIDHLGRAGILAVFHYVPLHTSPMGIRFGGGAGKLPVTEEMAGRLLRLPLYFELSRSDQDRVIAEIHAFFGKK
jgi:dTDP-4-amino-4,6-dideoxygalactose transaminase